jgi:hypothetical protein
MKRTFAFVVALVAVAAGASFGVGVTATPQATLTASDAEANDSLGVSVALDGDTLAAGANLRNSGQGAVYVFTRTGTTWTPQQTLAATDAENGDHFGWSVSLAGDTVLAGARRKAASEGAAYVFTRTGTTWTQQQRLVPDDAAAGDFIGQSVAVSGDTAVVGAAKKDATRGAAYVFTRTYDTWTQQQKLVASDAADGAAFGISVAASGDTAVVGAFGANAAYVFTRTGATWTEQQKLTAADAVVGDFFGDAVAVAGDTVLIGAFEQSSRRGAVYVFTRTGTTWARQAKLVADDAAEGDKFGASVSLSGDTVAVGALLAADGCGAAYVFTRTGTTWTQQAKLGPDDADVDEFGDAVAVSGDTVTAGAELTNGARGAAYVFALSPVVDPPPPPAPAGYCLPTKVKAKLDAKHPAKSTLTASGTLDTGSDAPDFSGAATFDVGGLHLDVPAFVAKGRTLTYAAGGVALTITPTKNGSSRATFGVKAVGDFAGKVDLDGPLTFRFANAVHDLGGTATLSAGVLRRRAVTAPDLSVLSATATIKGRGKDALNLTLGFATDGTVPSAAEGLTIAFGGTFTVPLAAATFVRRGDAWVRAAKAPGITKAVVDYAKGTITIAGSRLDLGSFAQGVDAVVVTITRGGQTRSASVRIVRTGATLAY